VSLKHKLRKVLLIGALGVGSLIGMPMPPEEIEELLCQMNQPTIELVVKEKDDEPMS
jgi:hypothetical protein